MPKEEHHSYFIVLSPSSPAADWARMCRRLEMRLSDGYCGILVWQSGETLRNSGKCYAADLETPGYVPQVVEKGDNILALRLLQLLQWNPRSPAYLRTTLGIASREYFTKAYLRPLTGAGLIARTDPDHPNSPRQKYALTEDGRERIRRVATL